jgi:hypothetical protein
MLSQYNYLQFWKKERFFSSPLMGELVAGWVGVKSSKFPVNKRNLKESESAGIRL